MFRGFLRLSLVFLCIGPLLAESAIAQQRPNLASDAERLKCIKALAADFPSVTDFNFISPKTLRGKAECNFGILDNHGKIGAVLDTQIAGKKEAKVENVTNLRDFKNQIAVTVSTFSPKLQTSDVNQRLDNYFRDVSLYLPQMSYKKMASGGYGYTPVLSEIKTKFKFDISDTDAGFEYSYLADWSLNSSECQTSTSKCITYVEAYIIGLIVNEVWAENAKATNADALKLLTKAETNYETFFFDAGDGLYPWELFANNLLSKDRDILNPPNVKFNVFHPAPIVSYSNSSGDIEPGFMVEALGFTKLDYDKKLHFGGALAADFSDDQFRYGAVIHLPISAAFKEMGFEGASKIIPCEVCSFVVMTDGNDDWSVGVKMNVAGWLYSQDNNLPGFLQDLIQ